MRCDFTKEELDTWYELVGQKVNGYHLSDQDKTDLIRLNSRVLETTHDVHNAGGEV